MTPPVLAAPAKKKTLRTRLRHAFQYAETLARSAAFEIGYWAVSIGFVVACVPVALLPGRKPVETLIKGYVDTMMGLMRHVAGIRIEVKGKENLPKEGGFIVAGKHHSWGDGYPMVASVPQLTFVTGDHLLDYPVLGTVLKKFGAIVVNSCGGHEARAKLAHAFSEAADEARRVLIYPEGHLAAPGEKFAYRTGVWHMQEATRRRGLETGRGEGWPVVPVATNLGLRWQQQNFRKIPGPVTIEFLKPIPAGLEKDDMLAKLEATIETRTDQLIAEGLKADAEAGRAVREVSTPAKLVAYTPSERQQKKNAKKSAKARLSLPQDATVDVTADTASRRSIDLPQLSARNGVQPPQPPQP